MLSPKVWFKRISLISEAVGSVDRLSWGIVSSARKRERESYESIENDLFPSVMISISLAFRIEESAFVCGARS